jgi:hypothetical protein
MSEIEDALYALAALGQHGQRCRECQREYYVSHGATVLVCHCKETPNEDGTTTGVVTPIVCDMVTRMVARVSGLCRADESGSQVIGICVRCAGRVFKQGAVLKCERCGQEWG